MSMETLERRAIACKHWRWLPGMLVAYDERLGGRWHTRMIGNTPSSALLNANPLPDLTDPATQGCLLALVREAYDQPLACCRYVEANPAFWHINTGHVGATEAEALVAALEAAP